MKHETIEREPGLHDLERALALSSLKPSTRQATLTSLRLIDDALSTGGVLAVSDIEHALANITPELRSRLGPRASQILSDARRAMRVWSDASTRFLALSLRERIPTLRDAVLAARHALNTDQAPRAEAALESLAAAQNASLDDLPATETSVALYFKTASPEDLGVSTKKTLENKRSLCLRAVRLVDPMSRETRNVQLERLQPNWRKRFEAVKSGLAEHETSALAILKRFVTFAEGFGTTPDDIGSDVVEAFYKRERALHSKTHEEKLRRFARAWNETARMAGAHKLLPLPSVQIPRLPDVSWADVPDTIREPLDTYLARAISVRAQADWGDLVPDDEVDEYAEFGLENEKVTAGDVDKGAPILEPGTQENWRDAVKRAWHAASNEPRITRIPETLQDLLDVDVARALVLAVRKTRRDRAEAKGETFNPKEKGRYEHGLVETLHTIARHFELAPGRLEALSEFKVSIDPMVIAVKLGADGQKKRIYAPRRIGKRHAKKLAAFADETRLRRYFESPGGFWEKACRGIESGRRPNQKHIAFARNALILRIAQFVGPLRRMGMVGLRYTGDDPHLILPIGEGPGILHIPAIETKALVEIRVEIDPETVRMLKLYIEKFLPEARRLAKARPENPHLFPGFPVKDNKESRFPPGLGHVSKAKANNTFRQQLWREFRLDLNLHVLRHLAGKIILDQDPSAMELVRILLGHEKIETTQSYYAEVNAIIAQRRYLHLLQKSQRQVLAKINFKKLEPKNG